uniref:Uncharacterized protein n=1 Tax=Aegilops tauschii subsp. strangulata TaxID=200361 RepID=A0A453PJH9_AEGTS
LIIYICLSISNTFFSCMHVCRDFRASCEAEAAGDGRRRLAMLPPRGWNSYDSFSWTIDEAAFLHNAQIMADRLLP